MGKQIKHLMDEVDIGSGEKTPAEQETENLIDQLGRHEAHRQQGSGQQPHAVRHKDHKDQGPAPHHQKGH